MKKDINGQDFFVKDFKQLEVWKKAVSLSEKIYKLAKGFPKHEQYGLRSQLERASVSTFSNLAEGQGYAGLFPNQELRFYSISLGSAYEVRAQIELIYRVGFVNLETYEELENEVCQIIKMLIPLIKKVKREIA
ncbi:four helix bundle protein [Niallia circulans]|uniref:four helix bundle protein n=1 Tax=Niallia circulans TaxID=1397 RepID=UPI00300A4B0E